MYTHTGDPVPPSDKATIYLDPPRYGSVVGFKRLQSGWQYYYVALCEVVVIGSRSIGKTYLALKFENRILCVDPCPGSLAIISHLNTSPIVRIIPGCTKCPLSATCDTFNGCSRCSNGTKLPDCIQGLI